VDVAIDWMGKETAGVATNNAIMEFWHFWSVNVFSWTGTPQSEIEIVRYEDMLGDSYGTFSRVAGFLRLPVSEGGIEKTIRYSSFDEMRSQELAGGFKETRPRNEGFFSAGVADRWKTQLTGEQVDRIIDNHGEQMQRFGYLPTRE